MTPAEAVSLVRACAVAVLWISLATSGAFASAVFVGHCWQALREPRKPASLPSVTLPRSQRTTTGRGSRLFDN
jgi:hypothetical protein